MNSSATPARTDEEEVKDKDGLQQLGLRDAEQCREALTRFYIECITRFNTPTNEEYEEDSQTNVYSSEDVTMRRLIVYDTGRFRKKKPDDENINIETLFSKRVRKITPENKAKIRAALDSLIQRQIETYTQYLGSLSLHALASEVVTIVRMYLTYRETEYINTVKTLMEVAGPNAKERLRKIKREGPSMDSTALDILNKAAQEAEAETVPKLIYAHLETKFNRQLSKKKKELREVQLQLEEAKNETAEANIVSQRLLKENKELQERVKWWKTNCGTQKNEADAKVPADGSAADGATLSTSDPSSNEASAEKEVKFHTGLTPGPSPAVTPARSRAHSPVRRRTDDGIDRASDKTMVRDLETTLQTKNKRIGELEAELFKQKYHVRASQQRLNEANVDILNLKRQLASQKKKQGSQKRTTR
eukprot:jgi/Bigna1/132282/aug1.17_g6990